jgi:hypothetical protein
MHSSDCARLHLRGNCHSGASVTKLWQFQIWCIGFLEVSSRSGAPGSPTDAVFASFGVVEAEPKDLLSGAGSRTLPALLYPNQQRHSERATRAEESFVLLHYGKTQDPSTSVGMTPLDSFCRAAIPTPESPVAQNGPLKLFCLSGPFASKLRETDATSRLANR